MRAVRVENPPEWRWGTADAAFLARVVQRLGRPREDIRFRGCRRTCRSCSRSRARGPRRRRGPGRPDPGLVARVGALAMERARNLPAVRERCSGRSCFCCRDSCAGRARVRAAEMLEVLAESSSRALLIVGVVNVLMGAILAFVGAVQLKPFGAGIYVANLVGIASARELTPDPDGDRPGRPHRRQLRRPHRHHAGQRRDRRAHHARRLSGRVPGASARRGAEPADAAAVCLRLRACAVRRPVASRCRSSTCRAVTYMAQTQQAIGGAQFAIGGLKAFVFGALVALLGCHFGLRAERSAAGVGAATTSAVVSLDRRRSSRSMPSSRCARMRSKSEQ